MRPFIIALGLFSISIFTFSQGYKTTEGSELNIEGTSSIHDWECDVNSFWAYAKYDGTAFTEISFTARVISIKSGKSSMDNNIYAAMNQTKYPEIKFKSDQLVISGGKARGQGSLTMNGKTQSIQLELDVKEGSMLSVSGKVSLKMTDYGIEPPVAVFGTIKTGDEIVLIINLKLDRQ